MNDLELCKAIAEIEGIEYETNHQGVIGTIEGEEGGLHPQVFMSYNPITDKALLWDLMVKYEVEIDYQTMRCVLLDPKLYHDDLDVKHVVDYDGECQIPTVVLECIIKAHADDK